MAGAAPEVLAFPLLNLPALILTARTLLWQTSAENWQYNHLLRGKSAGQRQQQADSRISTCSLSHPTVSFFLILQESLCEEDASPLPFSAYWKELALLEVAFMKLKGRHDSTAVSLKIFFSLPISNQWIFSYGFHLGGHNRMCICFFSHLSLSVQVLLNGWICTCGLFLDNGYKHLVFRWLKLYLSLIQTGGGSGHFLTVSWASSGNVCTV